MVAEDNFVDIIGIDGGCFEVADGANNIFGPEFAALWCRDFKLALDIADDLETLKFVDTVFEVWAMFLKDI